MIATLLKPMSKAVIWNKKTLASIDSFRYKDFLKKNQALSLSEIAHSEPKYMRASPLEINGEVILPGERRTLKIPVAAMVTNADVDLTVQVIHGKKPGPVLLVSAAIHGDDLNGVEVIRRLLKLTPANNTIRYLNCGAYCTYSWFCFPQRLPAWWQSPEPGSHRFCKRCS